MITALVNIFRKRAAADDAVKENARATAGFTLVETLAAMVVVALLTGIVAMGMSAGLTIYEKTMFSSESSGLASTIDSALAGPLRYATYDKKADTYSVTYRGLVYPAAVFVKDDRIYLGDVTTNTLLLNESAYTDCKVSAISLARSGADFKLTYTITDSKGGLSKDYGINPVIQYEAVTSVLGSQS